MILTLFVLVPALTHQMTMPLSIQTFSIFLPLLIKPVFTENCFDPVIKIADPQPISNYIKQIYFRFHSCLISQFNLDL